MINIQPTKLDKLGKLGKMNGRANDKNNGKAVELWQMGKRKSNQKTNQKSSQWAITQ